MFRRVLLDDEDFMLTVGVFGGMRIVAKYRKITIKAIREESEYLHCVVKILERSGADASPGNPQLRNLFHQFCSAVAVRGGWLWQDFFAARTPDDTARELR